LERCDRKHKQGLAPSTRAEAAATSARRCCNDEHS
jgi:hypothetical protein